MTEAFHAYLQDAVGTLLSGRVLSSHEGEPVCAVRANPSKMGVEALSRHFAPFGPSPVEWCQEGLALSPRPPFTLDPVLHGGGYYVQDPSSMFVGTLSSLTLPSDIPPGQPVRVLDLCAAPGGKSTHLASVLRGIYGNGFLLVSNEVIRQRASALADNMARWGDPCVVVTSVDPAVLGRMEGFFDVVVVDAPCSGEGMFRKDPSSREQWSEDAVSLCAQRQRRILSDVLPALREGGTLVYSTCTFNMVENEGNVRFLEENFGLVECGVDDGTEGEWTGAGILKSPLRGWRLLPGVVRGEGQYACALRRGDGPPRSKPAGRSKPSVGGPSSLLEGDFATLKRDNMTLAVPSGTVTLLPALEKLHPLRTGVLLGESKGRDFCPDADLALCPFLRPDVFPRVDLSREEALSFLHKDPLAFPGMKTGYLLLCHDSIPLGFVKNLGNRSNNLLPSSRRIRMDIAAGH